jgi:CRISPR-associated endoribonuclease Cas6
MSLSDGQPSNRYRSVYVLASFVIALSVDRDLILPGLGGEALHGLFFEALRAHDAAFAAHLHDLPGDKPFTLSGVLTNYPKRQGRMHVTANSQLAFRVSGLTDALIEHPLAAFSHLATIDAPLRLGPGMARVDKITFQAGMHPLVQSASYPALLHNASDNARVTLQFSSPTSFRAGDAQEIMPKPERVFGSLFNTWQSFSPVPFAPELAGELALMQVSEYELRTELVHFSRYKVIGFKGHVTYTCPRSMHVSVRRAVNTLADFAVFAGVGYKTTMGLGQVTRR